VATNPEVVDNSFDEDHVESLSTSLKNLSESHDLSKGLSIGDLFDSFGTKGFGVIMALLALPSALPIPAPGYSTPFGILLAIFGFQILKGRTEPALPNWARKRKIPAVLAKGMVGRGAGIASFFEKLLHPRLLWLQNKTLFRFLAFVIIFMAGLMILPIPLTNTAPAFVIFVISVGMIERDGFFLGGSVFLSIAALVLYIAVLYVVITTIMKTGFDWQAITAEVDAMKEEIKTFIKGLLGKE